MSDRLPLLLLHGFLGDTGDWHPMLNAMAPRDMDAYIHPPIPGDFVPVCEGAKAFDEYVRLLTGRLDLQQADACDAIGYSLGGRLLYAFLKQAPHRIRRFVALGARAAPDSMARAARDEQWARMLERDSLATFVDAWYDQPIFASLQRTPQFEGVRKRRLARKRPAWLATALRAFSAAYQPDFTSVLQTTPRRGLLIAGERDRFYVEQNTTLAQANPNLEAVVIPGAGHALLAEAPEAVARVVEKFLDTE